MMYIKRTYYSYCVYLKGRKIAEFASYSEAREYINEIIIKEEN